MGGQTSTVVNDRNTGPCNTTKYGRIRRNTDRVRSFTSVYWFRNRRPGYLLKLKLLDLTVTGRFRANHTQRKPMFCIEFWNMYNRTTQSLVRTNNSAEAYHRRIRLIFQCTHRTLWVFLQKLIDKENAIHADIIT